MFQFTRPQGARRLHTLSLRPRDRFNSRARKGRDNRHQPIYRWRGVSIHAPARGATSEHVIDGPYDFVFQFTRPQGARPAVGWVADCWGTVSIHAPARGATRYDLHYFTFMACFNSRARKGRDRTTRRTARKRVSFNSRARKGRDIHINVFNGGRWFQFTRPQGARH